MRFGVGSRSRRLRHRRSDGSGIVFDLDNTMNQLQCFFYRDGNRKIGDAGKWSFDERVLDEGELTAFIHQRVIPEIDRRRSRM